MIPFVPCDCGQVMLPGAALDGVMRRWTCVCGAERWRSDQMPLAPAAAAPTPPPDQGALF